jgi:hypothetical protein
VCIARIGFHAEARSAQAYAPAAGSLLTKENAKSRVPRLRARAMMSMRPMMLDRPWLCKATTRPRVDERQKNQQPAKNAVRKSKKSWESVAPEWLKSASPAKKAVRKSK